MKNVAKCDTWCELQNPANHRVFERKLRPKPFGRGHVCLGVTHRCPPQTPVRAGRKLASRACACARLAQKRVLGDERHDNRWFSCPRSSSCAPRRSNALFDPHASSHRRRSQRDPRSGGTTR
ncbi:hypothetical protein RGQ29_000005 [Quercus rubra]|uniref:Uncharacterized protein n=1 Tax=Quercus rubra TaxID=3512 RepID=A0AAN7G4L6_QUERU|nr:hypothetical protein RGQ29_000005 [Quercus rubra]